LDWGDKDQDYGDEEGGRGASFRSPPRPAEAIQGMLRSAIRAEPGQLSGPWWLTAAQLSLIARPNEQRAQRVAQPCAGIGENEPCKYF
jgi:hypothetical protein